MSVINNSNITNINSNKTNGNITNSNRNSNKTSINGNNSNINNSNGNSNITSINSINSINNSNSNITSINRNSNKTSINQNSIRNITNLKKFINNLKNNASSNCPCSSQNIKDKPKSKAQLVQICGNKVIKSSQNKIKSIRIEKKNNHSIKIDNITLNLLIQSITKKYVNTNNKNLKINPLRIEHYNNLCKESNKIKLISKKASYNGIIKQINKTFPTLEDYILKSNDDINDKIEVIKYSLTQSFEILDKLFNEIQFHHCDPKCAQLFLFNKPNNPNSKLPICMLADLDKVTFTIKINKNLYRILLTKDKEINTIRGKVISAAEKIKFLNKLTAMRYESIARKSNLLEKITFISSACILLNNSLKSKQLRDDMLKQILPKYNKNINKLDFNRIINLDNYYSPFKLSSNKITSFYVAFKYIDYNYLYKNFKIYLESETDLHSIICLEPNTNFDKKYILNFCPENNNNIGRNTITSYNEVMNNLLH